MKQTMAEPVSVPLQGRVHHLRGNQLLICNQPETVWVVAQGTLEMLSTCIRNDAPVSLRRHLFPMPANRAVFGCVPAAESGHLGLIGVAAGQVRVVEVAFDQFAAALAADDSRRALLDDWVNALCHCVAQGYETPTVTRPAEDGEYEFVQKESLSAPTGGLLAVRITAGTLHLTGRPDLVLTPHSGPILLGSDLWLEVGSESAQLTVCARPWAESPELLAQGLTTLHKCLHLHHKLLADAEEREEAQRRQVSKQLRDMESAEAMEDLAAVLSPNERFPLRETPLLTALATVASVQGLQIRPPLESEDMSRVNDPIEAIARASRVRWRKVLLGPDWWKADTGPLLAYLGEEERKPVALLPSGTGYVIVDPDRRQRQPLTPALRDQLCLEAYMLYRGLSNHMNRMMDLVRFTATGRGGDFLFLLLMALAATLLGMIAPRVTGVLVDTAIPSADRGLLIELALLLTTAGAAGAACTYLQVMTTVRASIATEQVSQSAIWDRLLKLRPDFLRRFSSGDLETRTNVITEMTRDLSSATLRPLISGVLAILNWLLLWYYSWELAKVALWLALLVLVVTLVVSHFVRKLTFLLNDLEGGFNGLMIQMIGGVGKLRVAGGEYRAFNHWLSRYTVIVRLKRRLKLWKDLIHIFNLVLPTAATAIIFWRTVKLREGVAFDSPDYISIGSFIGFNTAFILYLAGWTDVSNTIVNVLDALMKGRRAKPLLEAMPEVAAGASDPGRLHGHIRFESVAFRYSPEGQMILKELSFEVQPGEFVAFVGPSGSGKSTLLRVLLGFERPSSGRVLYEGQDLAGLDVLAVRRQLGTVLQNGRLNAGSILDNISNNAKVSYVEAWEAVADAGMSDDVHAMPMGLHTVVAEGGANLSGGQRQRILIARALVTRPKIVFFDEATSALDNKTQATISQALERRKVTRLVIAHRLSTIRNADRIYVMDRGEIVQQGTFDELVEQEGLFKDLVARQRA